MVLMAPSILGAAAFPFVFRWLGNKGRTAALFSAGTGAALLRAAVPMAMPSLLPRETKAY